MRRSAPRGPELHETDGIARRTPPGESSVCSSVWRRRELSPTQPYVGERGRTPRIEWNARTSVHVRTPLDGLSSSGVAWAIRCSQTPIPTDLPPGTKFFSGSKLAAPWGQGDPKIGNEIQSLTASLRGGHRRGRPFLRAVSAPTGSCRGRIDRHPRRQERPQFQSPRAGSPGIREHFDEYVAGILSGLSLRHAHGSADLANVSKTNCGS